MVGASEYRAIHELLGDVAGNEPPCDLEHLDAVLDEVQGHAQAIRNAISKELGKDESHWKNDPEYTPDDWRAEVVNDDTRLGYKEWVEHQKEANG